MRLSTVRLSMTLLATSGVAMFSAASALAQSECEADADCDTGFVCEVVGGSTCGSAPPCVEGEECPEPEPCESEVFYGCVQGPCMSDADCGEGMICQESVVESCAGGAPACDPNGDCAAPEPVECETSSSAQCVYQWQAGCTVDADCGDGFTCVEGPASCACGGSADAEAPAALIAPEGLDGGAALPVPPVSEEPEPCSCDSSGSLYCQAQEIECMSDADCPAAWTCTTAPQAACGGGSDGVPAMMVDSGARPAELLPVAMDAGAAEPAEPIDPETEATGAPPPDEPPVGCEEIVAAPKSMCTPPGDYAGVPRPGVPGSDPAQGPDGENTGAPPVDDPTTAPVPLPGTDEGDNGGTDEEDVATEGEAAGETATDEDAVATSSDDTEDEPNNNGVEDDAGDSGDSGGCALQVPTSDSSAGAWLLGLLGLGLLRRRRS